MNSESNSKSRLKTTEKKLLVRFNGLGLLDWEFIPRRLIIQTNKSILHKFIEIVLDVNNKF
ncbi:MAG: hypothetical protein AN485_06325 [Anabaena sp. MDT14b]|nr:MAG: hypothetical protein AN485_06325 [Anabaena sp. MDT14b]